jgi:hypothetical protein
LTSKLAESMGPAQPIHPASDRDVVLAGGSIGEDFES